MTRAMPDGLLGLATAIVGIPSVSHHEQVMADAVQAALTQAPFQTAPSSSPDVLTLAIQDKVRTEKEQYIFTVAFSRDGVKLGEAVESCPTKKLAECTDQLVLDTKTAANN